MKKLFLLATGFAALSLGSCSRSNYAFNNAVPAYLGAQPVPAASQPVAAAPAVAAAQPEALATTPAAAAPRPHASRMARLHATAPATAAPVAAATAAKPQAAASLDRKALKRELKRHLATAPREAAEGSKSQLAALLLCIFLGGLGIHQFYLGYTGRGVLRLLLFIFGFLIIPAIVNFVLYIIDIIKIANGDLKPRDGDYAKKL